MSIDILEYPHVQSFHSNYLRRNKPVVLRGLRKGYPLKIFDWSVDYFRRAMGDVKVPIMANDSGWFIYERNLVDMTFAEFAQHLQGANARDGRQYYYKNLLQQLPPGHDDSSELKLLAPQINAAVMRTLWISGQGPVVGLHFDHAENLNFQLRGRKNFTLYPPGVKPYYPDPLFSRSPHISRISRSGPSPDLGKFPLFDPTQGIRVEMHEGDVLYLPVYWWHQVESLGNENVNVNFWWRPAVSKALRNFNQAMRGFVLMGRRLIDFGNISQAPTKAAP